LAGRADETSTLRGFHALGIKQVEGQMTRLGDVVLGGLAALAVGGVASSALAEESGSFQNRLNGATVGLPLGALPPPGLYTGLETVYLGTLGVGPSTTGNQNTAVGRTYLPAIAQAVPLLWVPGWHFLGASYAMSVVQAFYNNNNTGTGSPGTPFGTPATPVGSGQYTTANTTWNPIVLSWNLGTGWFASVGFNFMSPDGTHTSKGSLFTPNPDYWTFEPTFAIAYLASSWNLAGNFFYDINSASKGNCCAQATVTGGNTLYGDFHALYKLGKWSIGPVAYFEQQVTKDTGSGCPTFCGNLSNVAVGGLVGYDFGPVDLQVWITDSVARSNAIDGLDIWTRLGFRIWAPEAPKPLVAKN
jgi:hypothetical protein